MFKKINNAYIYKFSVDSEGLYSISISAICKKKNHLRVEIDGMALKGIMPKSRNEFFNIPPAWNGNELKNIAKTVVFIVKLRKGNHSLKFIPKSEADIVSEPVVTLLDKSGHLTLFKDIQSEERNCQPWIAIALIDLPLSTLDISVSCGKKFLDSDDAKLIIDGRVQKNSKAIWRGKNWFWRGRQLKGKTQTDRFYLNLPSGAHYIELWADRTPKLHSLELGISGGGIDKGEYANRNFEWWEKWKSLKVYTYKGVSGDEDYSRYDDLIVKATAYWNKDFFSDLFPPDEPLDPNLVKAMIFQESRIGNDPNGKLNIMQVGNFGDSSLDVLNGRGVTKEYELQNNKIREINYHGKAQVVDVYDSIYWGIRWLYHKAQWIDGDEVRHWYSWKEAVARYGPPKEEYVNNVWDIYIQGIKKEKTGVIRLWSVVLFILLFLFFGKSSVNSIEAKISDKVIKEQNQKITGIDIEYSKNKKYFLAQIEREKDWWEDLKFGKIDNEDFNWLLFDKPPGEQAILSAKFTGSRGLGNPLVEVYGLTHAGHGHLYIYEIKDDTLKLLFEEPAVDYNPDIRWSPDNFEKYGYGQCGETIRGGRLSYSFKDVNNNAVSEVILSGIEDIICEKMLGDKIKEIKVASNPVYKVFYLPQSIALNVSSF